MPAGLPIDLMCILIRPVPLTPPDRLYRHGVCYGCNMSDRTVLITGATGMIGGAVVRAMQRRGRHVVGLARTDTAARQLCEQGIEPLAGDLADRAWLQRGVAMADVVVHAAFARDAYDRIDAAVAMEQRATAAVLGAATAAGRRFVYTSGLGVVGDSVRPAGDDDEPTTPPAMAWRRALELKVINAGGIVVRPAFVYGNGEGAILRGLIAYAAKNGRAVYAGDGGNAWPNVHLDDLGEAYALVIERGPAGKVVNVAGGEATPRTVGNAISRLLGLGPAESVPLEEAIQHVPFAAWISRASIRVDSQRVQSLGWRPNGPDIQWDIEFGSYRHLGKDTAR
jgi:nucleoside-diphosphate-sugar epimerase